MQLELVAGPARVVVDTGQGGRIASLCVDDLELLVSGNDSPLHWGCYPMAPFAGRVRHGRFKYGTREYQLPLNMPPHAHAGTVYDQEWKVEHVDTTDTVLVTDLGDTWPFRGRVVHRIRADDDGLELRLEVWAEEEPFPASCGWHPWWRRRLSRGAPLELELAAGAMWERGADGLPTGALTSPPPGPWDDCFTDLRSPPRLRWQDAIEVTIESTCMDVVVFDVPSYAVCVEPQTGPPDGLRLTPLVVEPGLPLVAECRFAWHLLA